MMTILSPKKSPFSFISATVLALTLNGATPSVGCSEELKDLLGRVQKLADEKNFPKALDELGWVQKDLQKKHGEQLTQFFPDQVKGFTGDKVQVNSTLGFSQVERNYAEGERSLTLSLTGGTSVGGLGNLAQLGKFAAMAGGDSGQEAVRIKGKTGQLEGDAESGFTLSLFLDSGSVLKVSATSGISSEELTQFAEILKLEELDKYLRG
jgi:hypothetical protein